MIRFDTRKFSWVSQIAKGGVNTLYDLLPGWVSPSSALLFMKSWLGGSGAWQYVPSNEFVDHGQSIPELEALGVGPLLYDENGPGLRKMRANSGGQTIINNLASVGSLTSPIRRNPNFTHLLFGATDLIPVGTSISYTLVSADFVRVLPLGTFAGTGGVITRTFAIGPGINTANVGTNWFVNGLVPALWVLSVIITAGPGPYACVVTMDELF